MAHFHIPKPLHGWREFAGEVGIIVLGVLIALACEGVVERIQWAIRVRDGRASLRQEIAFNQRYFDDRIAVAPCVRRHLEETAALIEQASRSGRLPKLENVSLHLARGIQLAAWQSQQATGTLVHFPPQELAQLSRYYMETIGAETWRSDEVDAWTGLGIMDGPAKRITDSDVAQLRVRLQMAKRYEGVWESNAPPQGVLARELGITARPPDQRYIASVCQDIRIIRSPAAQ